MDIEQLSALVRNLVLDSDEVLVPGLGTFYAEVVPASFSDRGFTVNPPYRKLTFVAQNPEQTPDQVGGDQAVKVGDDAAVMPDRRRASVVEAEGLAECVEELKKQLKETRCVELPGLGKLRLTKSDQYFFVADEDVNIYPDGFGLEPVSLKNKEARPDSDAEGKKPGKTAGKKLFKAVKPLPKWAWAAIIAVGVIVLAIVTLRLLGTYAPDFIDRLLYSPEELAKLKGTL